MSLEDRVLAVSAEDHAILQTRIRDLEAVLNQNNTHLALTFKLTPAVANLLGLLLAVPLVTPEAIQHRLEIATDPKVAIHRLRNRLKAYHNALGLSLDEFVVQGQRHVGYWIEPTVKARLRALIEKTVGNILPIEEVFEAA